MARRQQVTQKQGRLTRRQRVALEEQQQDISLPAKPFRSTGPLEPKNEAQKRYMNAMKNSVLTFGVGPAGTGKTYVCAALAAQALENGECEKLILTRPALEAGESLGFLPGELEEKFDPYMQPFRDVLNERLGKTKVDYLIKQGTIEAVPLAYMRGRTFRNAWVILDEAQNTTPTQMKMFLTRIGMNATVIVNGDVSQKDIRGDSGLEDALHRVGSISAVRVVRFERADVVRSGIVGDILAAYDN